MGHTKGLEKASEEPVSPIVQWLLHSPWNYMGLGSNPGAPINQQMTLTRDTDSEPPSS